MRRKKKLTAEQYAEIINSQLEQINLYIVITQDEQVQQA
jgi:rRNA-processing protein FCF1